MLLKRAVYSFLTHQKKQFWLLQVGGWCGYALIVYLSVYAPSSTGSRIVLQLQTLFFESLWGFLCSMLLRSVFHFVWNKSLQTRIVASLLSVFIASTIWTLAKHSSYRFIRDIDILPITWLDFGAWFLFSFASLLAWTTLYYGILYYQQLQEQHRKALRAESIAKEAQLKMLRYQLNPHFMFNSMNAVSTLILKNENEKANDMLNQLCFLLRNSLDSDPMQKVTVEQELQTLNRYLNIEKIRFAERLVVHINCAKEVEQALLPGLIIQPLVENSVKYAVAKSKNGATVKIDINKVGEQRLKISVEDDGPGISNEIKKHKGPGGVGLSNTRDRLLALYNDQYDLDISAVEPQGFKVVILIPYEI